MLCVFLYVVMNYLFSTSTELALPALQDLTEHEGAFSRIHDNKMPGKRILWGGWACRLSQCLR
jgi:hypothetical protein